MSDSLPEKQRPIRSPMPVFSRPGDDEKVNDKKEEKKRARRSRKSDEVKDDKVVDDIVDEVKVKEEVKEEVKEKVKDDKVVDVKEKVKDDKVVDVDTTIAVYKPVYCHHYASIRPRNTSLITMKLPYKSTMLFIPSNEYVHCLKTQVIQKGERQLYIENSRQHKYMVVPPGTLIGYVTPINLSK